MRSIVVAYDQLRGIGASNDLPWKRGLPSDLRHFKELTNGGSVIMGRKTYDSMPGVLPNRENIVVTSHTIEAVDVIAVNSLTAAYAAAHGNQFVIGGERIFREALPDVDLVYATEVRETFPQADVFFPELGDEWREVAREAHLADERNKYDYDFVTFARKTPRSPLAP